MNNYVEKAPRRLVALLLGSALAVGGVFFYNKMYDSNKKAEIVNLQPVKSSSDNIIPAPSFDEAKRESSKRQQFLDYLLRTNTIPYCDGIVYDGDSSRASEYMYKSLVSNGFDKEQARIIRSAFKIKTDGKFDLMVPSFIDYRGKGLHTKIFVGKDVFEGNESNYLTSEDLRHMIVSNGGRQTEIYSKGSDHISTEELTKGLKEGTFREEILDNISRLDSFGRDVVSMKSGKFKVSQIYSNEVNVLFLHSSVSLIKNSQSASPLELSAIQKIIKEQYDNPELRDVRVPSEHYDIRKRLRF